MQRPTYELMYDQVRAIHRAITGNEAREVETRGEPLQARDATETVTRRFAELESWVRSIPLLAECMPPYAFVPPLDLIELDKELLIELALPGVMREDVRVERTGDVLVVSGTRLGEKASNGRAYRHAEIPRGPFRRVVSLPAELPLDQPRVEIENGIVRVHLHKLPTGAVAKA